MEETVKTNDKLITKKIYTLIGLNTLGNRTVLDIVIEDINDNNFWLDTLESLKVRGIKQIYFICIATNKNIDRVLKMTLPNTKIITSLTDIITLMYKYVGYKGRSTFIKQIKELYIQDTIEQFNNRFEQTLKSIIIH